jgi:Bifunctional DNA primase/polymerase, N-terminal
MDTMQHAALRYAARGWPVFPCRPQSKEPLTAHGFKDASTDPAAITSWWRRCPTANVAIATGAPGPDVVDFDVAKGKPGPASFARLRRSGLLAGAQALVATPSGGWHLYFAGNPNGQRNGSLPRHGVDFRGAGGYVLLPPSAVGGRHYVLTEHRAAGGIVDFAAIRRLLDPPTVRQPRCGLDASRSGDFRKLVEWVETRQAGDRNAPLFWACCRALETGAGDQILDDLREAAVRAGHDSRTAARTVESARRRVGAR